MEIDGIPPDLCREWSKRRSQIEAALAARGLDAGTLGRAAQVATLDTRKAKVKVDASDSLYAGFRREAAAIGHHADQILASVLGRLQRTWLDAGMDDTRLLDEVVGADGVTERASSFSRREAIADLAARRAVHGNSAAQAAERIERLAGMLVSDDRVVPVLAPAARTTGELLRVRDDTGRVVRTVDQSERRYTTIDLLAAEHDLLTRAHARRNAGTAIIPAHVVDQVLADQPSLDADQQTMVRTLVSDGADVSVVMGKAGNGKSTAIGAYRAALDAAGIPVVGVAPSATAAHQLARSAGIADTATVDRLLVEIQHGHRRLSRGVVVVLDEAGMCPTRTRLRLQQAVDAVHGKVIDVGDHRQIPSVDVGGGHYTLAQRLGATVLGQNHRFRDPVYRDAAELLRDRQPAAALELLRRHDAVSDQHDQPVAAWTAMVDDWLAHRDLGDQVLMLATERATVAQLNHLARAHLRHRGEVARRSHTYLAADGRREIRLAVGDEVILRRNDNRLPQPHGRTAAVRNGMTSRITRADRHGVTVRFNREHRTAQADVVLPAAYVGEHVDYGYARTVDTAQGATVDHSLFTPSVSTSAERAYVALSRGRHTNCIYATTDRSWIDAIGNARGHTFATDQQPNVTDDLTAHRAAQRQPRWLTDAHPKPYNETDRDLERRRRPEPEHTIELGL